MVHPLDIKRIIIKLFLIIIRHLTPNECIPSLVWSNSSTRLHSIRSIMALSACDLLRGHHGLEHIRPREGQFFGGKQLKKESISTFFFFLLLPFVAEGTLKEVMPTRPANLPPFCPSLRQGFPENPIASHTINTLSTCHSMACVGKWWLNSANKPAQQLLYKTIRSHPNTRSRGLIQSCRRSFPIH
jgi:hypothetical protein